MGLTNWQIFLYILLPQSLAIALPSFSANIIFLIKETSVFSIIALADLMYVAQDLIGLQYETDEALFSPSEFLFNHLATAFALLLLS